MQTWIHKFKCLDCQLHFVVYSFRQDWQVQACPECGRAGNFLHWLDSSPDPVFQFVPGLTPTTVLAGLD